MKKTPIVTKKGRPSSHTDAIATVICRRLAEGESLRDICKTDGMPTESTVRSWAIDDIKGFSAHYTRARDIGIDCEVDLLMETARDINTPVDRARLIVDTIKWRVSKLAPKRYGDRLALSGPEGGPVEIKHTVVSDLSTETLLRIAEELEAKRAAQFPTVRVAELEVGKCRVSEE